MTTFAARDASFVVRIWWERPESGAPVLRGSVQHVLTGEIAYFDDLRALAVSIARWCGGPDAGGEASKSDMPNRES